MPQPRISCAGGAYSPAWCPATRFAPPPHGGHCRHRAGGGLVCALGENRRRRALSCHPTPALALGDTAAHGRRPANYLTSNDKFLFWAAPPSLRFPAEREGTTSVTGETGSVRDPAPGAAYARHCLKNPSRPSTAAAANADATSARVPGKSRPSIPRPPGRKGCSRNSVAGSACGPYPSQ